MKPRVGIDVDGVLADLLTPSLRIASEMLGREVSMSDMTGWDLDSLFSSKEAVEDLWDRVGAAGVCRNLTPYDGAVDGMRALREVADVYIVTAYLHNGPTWTHERDAWVQEHFAIPRSKIVHTKAKYIFAGDALVDDKPRNIEEWAREHTGMPVLWVQPYNSTHSFGVDLDARVERTSNWDVLVDLVHSLRG